MATSKTLAPTNVTISIPAMTDQPNASVLANCADKEADAINALNSQLKMKTSYLGGYTNASANTWADTGLTIVVPTGHVFIGVVTTGYSSGRPIGIGVDESATPTGSIPIQSAESENGQYGVNVFLWPGTWATMLISTLEIPETM